MESGYFELFIYKILLPLGSYFMAMMILNMSSVIVLSTNKQKDSIRLLKLNLLLFGLGMVLLLLAIIFFSKEVYYWIAVGFSFVLILIWNEIYINNLYKEDKRYYKTDELLDIIKQIHSEKADVAVLKEKLANAVLSDKEKEVLKSYIEKTSMRNKKEIFGWIDKK